MCSRCLAAKSRSLASAIRLCKKNLHRICSYPCALQLHPEGSIPQCKKLTTPNAELLAQCAAKRVAFPFVALRFSEALMSVAESYIGKPVAAEASLTVAGDRHELAVRKGTLGPDVIDITTLYAETGHFTYDPSFTSTASCESKITFIDGDKGVLLYRGYPIHQLAENGTFMETCYLLLYGELPTEEQYDTFRNLI